jgi:glycerol kinase
LAGLSLGIFKDKNALREAWQEDKTFVPVIDETARARRIASWHEAVAKA